jgi:CHAT domain-containing protein/tetratricopeptide (TPR) repeat protein
MRQLLSLLIFLFFSFSTHTQITYSLADTVLAKRLMTESNIFKEKYIFDSVYLKADSAYTIFSKIFNQENQEIADALNLKAISLTFKGKFDESLSTHEIALKIRLNIFGENSIAVGNSYNGIGIMYFRKGKYDKSIEFCQKAIDIFKNKAESSSLDLANSYNILGNSFLFKSDFDKSFDNFQKGLVLRSDYSDARYPNAGDFIHGISNVFGDKGDFEKALEYGLKALGIRQNTLGINHSSVAASFTNIANFYYSKGEYDKAIEYHLNAVKIYERISTDNSELAIPFNNLGNSYIQKGDFEKSILYYQKALDLRQKSLGIDHPDIALYYNNLGGAYRGLGINDKAINYIKKALTIRLKTFGNNSTYVAFCLNNLGGCYNNTKEYEKAIECLEKALEIRIKSLNPKSPSIANTLNNLGNSYEIKGDYKKAYEYYEKALLIFSKKDEIAQSINNLANTCTKSKDFGRADSLYNLALNTINFKNHNFEEAYSLVELVSTLFSKAQYESSRYNFTDSIIFLNRSSQTFTETINAINYQNKTFNTEGAKTELKNQQYAVYEGAIQTGSLLSKINMNNELLKKSFDYNEQIKASQLQAQIKESDALKYSNIPIDLLKKEQSLRLNIAVIEKQKQEKLNAGKSETDSTVLAISSKLFDLKQEYETLKQNLEKNYPEYYRLKYDLKTVSVDDVQKKMLSPQQTLLSYFVGDSSIFAFVVKSDTFAVFTIKKDFPLELYVKQLRDGLYGYQTANVKTEKLYEAKADSFAQAAYQLHEKLIRPLSILLTKEVILVPDGVLGYVPFDVLISEKPKDATKFNAHRYLGKDHIISYNYSATLWAEMQNKKHKTEPTKNFVGFAPYYNGDTTLLSQVFANDLTMRKGLDSLKYSGEEVFKAQKLMGGESVLAQKATKKSFEETANNYRIIHLATHGKANDKAGDYCFLAFTEQKDSIDNELLYVRDIYNLSLNADLVVLSACETGIGELKRGEGIVSLARAFAYAGAKSMVTTLWSVNDKSTMQIMENFYRNLRKGQTKSYALWKAKQDYWEKAKGEFAHPFYWSSFIPIGDMKAVK